MTVDLRPWRRLLPVWLPAVVLCLGTVVLYAWQSSESGGRRAQVRDRVLDLEAELARVEGLMRATGGTASGWKRPTPVHDSARRGVRDPRRPPDRYFAGRRFGDPQRGSASGELLLRRPGGQQDRLCPLQYPILGVEGEYRQIREMLAELQSSPEFLLVEGLSLSGDDDPVSQELKISVRIATFLVEADPQQLRRLTAGISGAAEGSDG